MDLIQYQDFLIQTAKSLFEIDSPSGFTTKVSEYVYNTIKEMGYSVYCNNLGNVIVKVEGKDNSHPVALSSHIDTLGLMVRSITNDGQLMITPIGSPILPTLDGEYCNIYTRDGQIYTGTILSLSPAIHVFDDATTRPRDEQNMAVRIDEIVNTKEDVKALGIEAGDFVCYNPKTIFTESGFLKSRFIDDKGCAALLITILKIMEKQKLVPQNLTYFCFTTHEEIGYGGSTLPSDIEELLVVDMGCVGADLNCTEQQVSICAKDKVGPYDYEMTNNLIQLSKRHKINYAIDIYPSYSSDAAAMWRAGYNTRSALIGPGVHASHGMERTHIEGLINTMKLIVSYIGINE